MDLKKFFDKKRAEHGIPLNYLPCTEEENEKFRKLKSEGKELPEGVKAFYREDAPVTFKKAEKIDLTQEQINELLMHKQIELLETIKTHTTFFYVLALIGIVLG